MKLGKLVALAAMALLGPATVLQACSSDSEVDGSSTSSGAGGGQSGGICLLNSCNSDLDCGGCSDGRSRCIVEENRCVACDPVSGKGCATGEECSPYGLCVPIGQKCETDDRGEPIFTCASDADCKACDPMHQVCFNAKCTACSPTDKSHCLASDVCIEGQCSPKCPKSCHTDAECGQCGGPGNEAHACNAHKCAECSDTLKCKDGLQCENGACVPGCGIPNSSKPGDCVSDEDCKFCGGGDAGATFVCKKPINQNKPTDHGGCVPKAQGCSDLGNGVAVLPAPWNQATNTCSSDANCANVDIQLNVGKLIRDVVGSDSINLGFKKIKIQDANVSYGMNQCAKIDLTESISCGICVPCKVDADCKPIAVDPIVKDLFKGDTLVQIASSFLIDYLYGDNEEHNLNFFCQPIAAGYGICAPCGNPLQTCGKGGGGGSGTCAHDKCVTGVALSCGDPCVNKVCAEDPYCCDTEWDSVCVGEVNKFCGAGTCGSTSSASSSSSTTSSSSGGGGGCAHDECKAGVKLASGCSTCATEVCKLDSFCCSDEWDLVCVDKAKGVKSCGC
ncbi:MAG: hypothetical protein FJ096_11515 [Deltaproteobacteria bacterium]|nr:hypothetical protein [Deltaproteobacteria bacterium]